MTFTGADREKSFTFTAAADSDNDDGESVKIGFGDLPAGVSAGSTDETTLFIMDDDVPTVTANFAHSAYTVDEGSTVTVKVTLNADPERTVTIPITKANQDGASNNDYSGVPANVTFNSGDTEAEITFAAAADSDNDDGESVKLGFGALPTGVSEGTTKDEAHRDHSDHRTTLRATRAARLRHGEGEAGLRGPAHGRERGYDDAVETVSITERTVTIPITKANQVGASDNDYSGVPANVTFDTEAAITFAAAADLHWFGALPTSEGTTKEATVSITATTCRP